jgi:hypothetical protein
MGAYKKTQRCLLPACAAKEYFFETPILLILLSKINRMGVSKKIIQPLFLHNLI